jgi:hypothetical protein
MSCIGFGKKEHWLRKWRGKGQGPLEVKRVNSGSSRRVELVVKGVVDRQADTHIYTDRRPGP